MAGETLKTASEVLASFPDNTSGLITALTERDFVVSIATGVGFIEDDPAQVPYTIPMVDGVPVDLFSTLVAPIFSGNFWKLDGNNAFVPAYADFGVTVPPGTIRLVSGSVFFSCEKVGNATFVDYLFQGTEGGVLTGSPVTKTINGGAPQLQGFSGTRSYQVDIGAPISMDITPVGHSDDLIVHDLRASLQGVLL